MVHQVTQPVMFVNTESFLNEDNLKKMETFAQVDKMERICYYIQGSVHQNHIDAPFLIRVCDIRHNAVRGDITSTFRRIHMGWLFLNP